MDSGKFVISLDFEIFWGIHADLNVDKYISNLKNTPIVVEKTLNIFNKNNIHATWATVGLLFAEGRKEANKYSPENKPSYKNVIYDSFKWLSGENPIEIKDSLLFAPKLIEKIIQTKHQELASHTFSHYFCSEPGQNIYQFKDDLNACQKISQHKFGLKLETMIFPKNQSKKDYFKMLEENHILSYRGQEEDWIHKINFIYIKKILRFLDSYVPISGNNSIEPYKIHNVINIYGSRFLRPIHRVFYPLERLKVIRIKKSMTHAAKKNLIYHLWWHPHNFGRDMDYHFKILNEIIEHFQMLQEKYNFQSRNIIEIANEMN